jgi:hypothetical protein
VRMSEGFTQPPRRQTPDGSLRRVGFELEYAGLDIVLAAEQLAQRLEVDVDQDNPFCLALTGHPCGSFRLEVDARLLKERRHLEALSGLGIDLGSTALQEPLEKALRSAASLIVPQELVTPPMPLDQLDLVDSLREMLRMQGARGTADSPLYSFGLHMNPELADHSARSLRDHMRAFVLLRDWIIAASGVNWSRRIGPHVRAWPEAWIEQLMAADYAPDRTQLADDYARLVGSRNHELDMLPALVELEGRRLLERVAEPGLVQPRPALHYRLPNCEIDDPAWRVSQAWNLWVEVEALAADSQRLDGLSQRWRTCRQGWLAGLTGEWGRIVGQHMDARGG